MFPSSNINPIEPLFKRPFPHDQNPISKHDDFPFLFHFPSPFFDAHDLPFNHVLSQNQLMGVHKFVANQSETLKDTIRKEVTENKTESSKQNQMSADNPIPTEPATHARRRTIDAVSRKRNWKKDRHSKICTAQGIRDRRMRLSVQVARKFFDLQDALGYDKASKTIEWLFSKSKKAIKELSQGHPDARVNSSSEEGKSESFMSGYEVISGIEEHSNVEIKTGEVEMNTPLLSNLYEKDRRKLRKAAPKHTRESRDRARARARDRTREKTIIKSLENSKFWYEPNTSNLQHLMTSITQFEAVEESVSQNQMQEFDCHSTENQLSDVSIIENLLGTSSSPYCPVYEYQGDTPAPFCLDSDIFMGFLGDSDRNNDRTTFIDCSVINPTPFAGNANSLLMTTPNFPFLHKPF